MNNFYQNLIFPVSLTFMFITNRSFCKKCGPESCGYENALSLAKNFNHINNRDHSIFSKSLNTRIEEQFRVLGFKNPIVPIASVSGFIYVNLDEGTKVVDIGLLGLSASGFGKTKFFTFFLAVPGIKADYQDVDFERLYSSNDIEKFFWDEGPISSMLKRLATDQKQDYDAMR